ncbi:MAG: flagellar basal body protein FliL [Desulfovibrio sp.]|nr:MAG: flagellar basal body protein FliL [Desulfovibrio sp.]
MLLFLVPEDDDATLEDDAREKALLDTEELAGDELDEGIKDKVELDLEDAPFLLDDEEEEEPEDEGPTDLPMEAEPEAEPSFFQKHKTIIIISGAGALVLIILLVVLLMSGGDPEPEPEPDLEPEEVPLEIPEPGEEMEEIVISWEPFWVELQDEGGQVRFLYCEFSTSTTDNLLARELIRKEIVLRDAIFYYLRNKDVTFLTDENNADSLKEGLLAAVNNHLSSGKVYTLMIEEYLVK